MEIEIVILAKSYKRGGYCIAGIDLKTGDWIRPISNNISNEGSVPSDDIIYEDGTELNILDKVKIKFLERANSNVQPENYIYDNQCYWVKTGTSSLDEIIKLRGYDDPKKIFYNYGKEVTELELTGGPSLLLLRVNKPCIFIKTFDRKKIQLNFEYKDNIYRYFKISDPIILSRYSDNIDGSYSIGEYLDVVVSLTDKYRESNKYYKMVAHIFN